MRKVRFRVLSCSGEDPSGPAALLNDHDNTGTGYLTPKHCEYPQELVIELETTARVTQIQVLSHQCYIATKIELYLSTDGETFSRLGFMNLKSNKESQYTARELKTVHIDAVTHFIKFKLHQCYVNEKNLYSQVGIVAINVNGDVPDDDIPAEAELESLSHVHQPLPAAPTPARSISKAKAKEAVATTPEDMRFDAKTAARIRDIHLAKEKAVAMEDYDQAKRLKALEEQLKSVGLQLARLEAAKRDAVANEDYDAAKRIKDEIAHLEAELSLDPPPARATMDTGRRPDPALSRQLANTRGDHIESGYPPAVPSLPKPQQRKVAPVVNDVLEQPLRAAAAPAMAQDDDGDDDTEVTAASTGPQGVIAGGSNPHFDGLPDCADLGDPEPLPNALEKESADMIDVIGLYLTQCFYSNAWNHRDAAIRKVTLDLDSYECAPEAVLQVASTLAQSGIADRISQVALSALALTDAMLVYAQDRAADLGAEIIGASLTNPLVQLVNKLGEPQAKIRDEVSNLLLKLAAADEIGVSVVGGHLCRRTTKKALAIKHLQGRLGLVKELIVQFGPASDDFTLQTIMSFLEDNAAFSHQSKEIRDAAKDITVLLHQLGGDDVEPFLKSLRPKLMEEYHAAFDVQTAKKAGKAAPSKAPPAKAARAAKAPVQVQDDGSDTDSNASVNEGTCPFCDEHSDAFDNERLDQHFWAECPMLTQCKMCGQVIEISTLNEHLLVECELKQNHKECPRCHEAITLKYFNQHVQQNDCDPMPDPSEGNRCPLCHEDIPPRKRGWKTHLLHEKCPQNPRTGG
ncbi:hypothetical protein ACHHYP_16869 [Achlya hypogyna]|uniref:TOG domain-containing protein n=1 Tax=Achlya hypogyna TaxID=1202772 RepID=A0A1V9Y5L2_ACHHY|nr:hypothetical protein ACHHYP_16869 [Achlya hypogyna]